MSPLPLWLVTFKLTSSWIVGRSSKGVKPRWEYFWWGNNCAKVPQKVVSGASGTECVTTNCEEQVPRERWRWGYEVSKTWDTEVMSQFSSVAQLCQTLCDPHRLQHTRLPCPSPTPGGCSNSCPLSQWCHPTISSSAIPFSSRLQSFPASGSFPVSQLFISGGQGIGVSASASVLPMNIQGWFPLQLTG